MGDERVERGPLLGRIDKRHRFPARGVGAEAVDGLGGEGDEPALGQDQRRRGEAVGTRRDRPRRDCSCALPFVHWPACSACEFAFDCPHHRMV